MLVNGLLVMFEFPFQPWPFSSLHDCRQLYFNMDRYRTQKHHLMAMEYAAKWVCQFSTLNTMSMDQRASFILHQFMTPELLKRAFLGGKTEYSQ